MWAVSDTNTGQHYQRQMNDDLHRLYDISRYPRDVPTVREQAEDKPWDMEEQIQTKRDLEHMTAIGEVRNPLAYRSWLEDEYEQPNPTDRTRVHLGMEPGFGGGRETVPDGNGKAVLSDVSCVNCGHTLKGGSVEWSLAVRPGSLFLLHSPKCVHHDTSGGVVISGSDVADATWSYLRSAKEQHGEARVLPRDVSSVEVSEIANHTSGAPQRGPG